MKNHKYYYPLRTSLAVIALGIAGVIIYQATNHTDQVVAAAPTTFRVSQRNRDTTAPPTQKPLESVVENVTPVAPAETLEGDAGGLVFKEFNAWAITYSTATPLQQKQMLPHGESIVKRRHELMAGLIEKSPQVALDEADALSPLAREALPESLKSQLEQHVNKRGDLRVMAYAGKDTVPYARFTVLDNEEYSVFPAGQSETLAKESNRSLLGIKLAVNRVATDKDGKRYPRVDKLMALRKERVRVLSKEEVTVAMKSLKKGAEPSCDISKTSVAVVEAPAAIETGGGEKWLCQPAHVPTWLKSPAGINAAAIPTGYAAFGGPGEGSGRYPRVDVGWSTGQKTFLVGKFRCADQATYPYPNLETIVRTMLRQVNRWSYGKITVTPTFTTLLTLPHTAAEYKYQPGQYSLRDDATAVMRQYYNVDSYTFYAACAADTLYNREGGADTVGRFMEISNPGNFIFQHELGHNIGLPHANVWDPSTSNPIGPGIWREYGGSYSSMGANNSSFNTMDRFYINWLTLNETHDLSSRTNGTYTIYDPDVLRTTVGRKYTIRIPRSDGSFYFVEFRPRANALADRSTVDATTQNGIRILRTPDAAQLDLTPQSLGGQFDGALVAGKEFYDERENITIKAIDMGGSVGSQYFNVQVIFNRSTIIPGRTYLLRSRDEGMTLGVDNSSGENSAPVTQQVRTNYTNQKWVILKADEFSHKLVNANSGKCLTVAGLSTANNGLVDQYQYVGADSQKWRIVSTDNGHFKLLNVLSGHALSSPFPTSRPGLQIKQYEYVGGDSQQWWFEEMTPLNPGNNYRIKALNSGKFLDIAGSSTADGTYIYQWLQSSYAAFQSFTASSHGGPAIALTNVGTQKVIEVGGYGMADGVGLQQWQWVGHSWQQWRLEAQDHDSEGFSYKLVNVGSGKAASVRGNSNDNGAPIEQYPWYGYTNQQWRFMRTN